MTSRRTHEETGEPRSNPVVARPTTAAPGEQSFGWAELGDLVIASRELADALAKQRA